jgi:hypothetical protein
MEQGNPPSKKALILFVDPEEFMEGIRETTKALPDARDPAWQALWKEMRAGLILQFEPTLIPHPRNPLDATDISAGTGREDEGDEEAGIPGGGRTWRGRRGSTSRRSDGEEYWASKRRKRIQVRAAKFREEMERGGYDYREGEHIKRSAARPPSPATRATNDGRGRASPKTLYELPLDLPRGRTATHPYGTARPLYRPPHEHRAIGGLAAAEEKEVPPQTVVPGVEGTYEHDYSYTRATRTLYSQNKTNKEIRGEPLMNIADRGDRGSQAARISHFLETHGGSLMEKEAEGSDTDPGLQWFP